MVLEKDGEYQGNMKKYVLYRVREKKILHKIKRAANWICLILRRDCLVKKNVLKEE